ncbi:hypothetical protein JCM5353_005023 [Sporobolomyces roseus]
MLVKLVTTTSGSHRNFSPPPSTWAPPFLVIDPTALPDFPRLSPARHTHALSHKSLVNVAPFEAESASMPFKLELASHKRLELDGDACLRFCLYAILSKRYPDMTVACTTEVCNYLLGNATLSWLAWHYGLFDEGMLQQARTDPKFVYNDPKPAADLFEAWLGAVSKEYPMEEFLRWLETIFSETVFNGLNEWLLDAQERERERHGLRKRKQMMTLKPDGAAARRKRQRQGKTAQIESQVSCLFTPSSSTRV